MPCASAGSRERRGAGMQGEKLDVTWNRIGWAAVTCRCHGLPLLEDQEGEEDYEYPSSN